MDKDGFTSFLKKKRKSENTIIACLEDASSFSEFLETRGIEPSKSSKKDLDLFVSSVLDESKVSKFMWGLQYYLEFIGNDELRKYAGQLRQKRVKKKRQPLKLKDIRGVNLDSVKRLTEVGITDIDEMFSAGRTKTGRDELSKKTGIGIDEILEFAKLSDIARIHAVKSIRSRLYHDSGFDSVEKLAKTTVEELRSVTREFIEKTGFEGIPPTPKEAEFTIKFAKKLPILLEL